MSRFLWFTVYIHLLQHILSANTACVIQHHNIHHP